MALARVGDLAAALRFAGTLSAAHPRGTLIQNYWLPVIQAQVNLHGDNARAAISPACDRTVRTVRYEVAAIASNHPRRSVPAGAHGRRDVPSSDLFEHHGVVGNSVLGSFARVRLAGALALAGDTNAAKKQYESFFRIVARR